MSKLPEEFADLERFTDWCLPTEEERYQSAWLDHGGNAGVLRRRAWPDSRTSWPTSTRGSRFDGMPEDAKALDPLMQSLVMVSFPVEVWKQPRVLDSGAAYISCIKEPVV